MSRDPQAELKQFRPTKAFFVGIDSDGCVFNSMEVKHNDCFSVAVVRHFGLQAISRQVHQAWDFVSLYSQTRACHRWRALLWTFDHLRAMPRVRRSGVVIPQLPHLRAWIERETAVGNARLAELIETATGARREELVDLMTWSRAVDRAIEETVHHLPPFPGVEACLVRLGAQADLIVVSGTPEEALRREWAEHRLDRHVALLAGLEMGSKSEHLTLAAKGKYPAEQVLMIGDAPGDLQAARDVGALFFPINPGAEEESWERFASEGMDRFFGKSYAGDYQAERIEEFMRLLPSDPPWKT
ncbi:MAG TPA: HAD family hydrolase [Polyangia bacterium]|nr:HAD family hydrolase [Polyangia bacterium]